MINVTTETLDGVTYLTTTNARGNTTMVYRMFGTTFVQTNRSPAQALQDIAKPSKDAKALVAILEA